MNDNNILDDITFEDIQREYFEKHGSNIVRKLNRNVRDIEERVVDEKIFSKDKINNYLIM